ncbi:MAG: hypothetical protein COB66_01375 [Coxiella sp. (in: Bacteria)]|nr:MAG: hypothetical protein COB66_01375 [Coxiella sp. (in: g-proteobacteria)]
MNKFTVGELCEARNLGKWYDCEVVGIADPKTRAMKSEQKGDYIILVPVDLNPNRSDGTWLARESTLRKKRPPKESDSSLEQAADKFIGKLKDSLFSEKQKELETEDG